MYMEVRDMKEMFTEPEVEIIQFEETDIITASGDELTERDP